MKENFSPLPAECGEKKFFTAKIANLTNIHRANFNAYLIFTGNIIEVSDRWRSGLRCWWHAWGRGSNPCTAVSFLEDFRWMRWKKKFSPQNSTQFLQKLIAFSAFNAKRCGRFAVKKVFFSPLVTANLTLFFVKTSTRVITPCWIWKKTVLKIIKLFNNQKTRLRQEKSTQLSTILIYERDCYCSANWTFGSLIKFDPFPSYHFTIWNFIAKTLLTE